MRLKLYNLLFAALSMGTAAEVVHSVQQCPPGQTLAWVATKVHHKHSKETLTKWAAWRKEHPDWKPKTTSETLAGFNWACEEITPVPVEQTTELDLANTIPVLDAEPKADDNPITQPEVKATLTTEGRTGTANVPTGANDTFYPTQITSWGFAGAPAGYIGTLPPTQKHPEPPCPPETPPVPEPSYLGVVLFGFAALIKFRNKDKA